MPARRAVIVIGLATAGWLTACHSAQSADTPDLGWLVGHWCTAPDAGSGEELWLPERGGLMIGLSRSVSNRDVAFEFLRIEIAVDGAQYVAQPQGAPPTRFRLVALDADAATFENPAHEHPKRIRYRRDGNRLFATVDGGADDPSPTEFRWKLCDGGQ